MPVHSAWHLPDGGIVDNVDLAYARPNSIHKGYACKPRRREPSKLKCELPMADQPVSRLPSGSVGKRGGLLEASGTPESPNRSFSEVLAQNGHRMGA